MKSILMDKQEERAINFLIIYAFSEGKAGLLKGRTGIAITFYLLGSQKGNDIYSVFGEKLLQSSLSGLTGGLSNGFATGLCGIGWGIEYLFRQNYIMCSSDTFESLDYRIMNTNLTEMDFSLSASPIRFGLFRCLWLLSSTMHFSYTLANSLQKSSAIQ